MEGVRGADANGGRGAPAEEPSSPHRLQLLPLVRSLSPVVGLKRVLGLGGDSSPDNEPPVDVERRTLSVFVATWNIGDARPADDMRCWLKPGYDIYCIGTQECQYAPRGSYKTCEEDWFATVERHVGDQYAVVKHMSITPMTVDTYKNETAFLEAVRLGKARSGGIRLSVLVLKQLMPYVRDVQSGIRTTGRINGLSGNKGGLGVALRLGESCIGVVTCHLNAHTENLERRNRDFRAIVDGLRFGPNGLDMTAECDIVFWCGDLNYRVDHDDREVRALLAAGRSNDLLQYDQLREAQRTGAAFAQFRETPITFAPTFKLCYDAATDAVCYSTQEQRTPSFCDRVLYSTWPQASLDAICAEAAEPASPVRPREYAAVMDMVRWTGSDHAAVYALFSVDVDILRPPDVPRSPCEPHRGTRSLMPNPEPMAVGTSACVHTISLSSLTADCDTSVLGAATDAYLRVFFRCGDVRLEESTGSEPMPRPHWSGKVRLRVTGYPLQYLCERHVVLALRNRRSAGTLLGEGVLSLRQAGIFRHQRSPASSPTAEIMSPTESPDSAVSSQPFTVRLFQHGMPCGTLCGRVKVV